MNVVLNELLVSLQSPGKDYAAIGESKREGPQGRPTTSCPHLYYSGLKVHPETRWSRIEELCFFQRSAETECFSPGGDILPSWHAQPFKRKL